jgi:hypothetical protein
MFACVCAPYSFSAFSFSAAFISLKPWRVLVSKLPHNSATSSPRNSSRCTKLLLLSLNGLISKICSPSKRPGIRKRPSHRNSRSGPTRVTRGLKVIGFPPGGEMLTFKSAPSFTTPTASEIKGFHSEKRSRSVRISHTLVGEAAISTSVAISLN